MSFEKAIVDSPSAIKMQPQHRTNRPPYRCMSFPQKGDSKPATKNAADSAPIIAVRLQPVSREIGPESIDKR